MTIRAGVPDPIPTQDRTPNAIYDDILRVRTAGARDDDLRLLAGRMSEPVNNPDPDPDPVWWGYEPKWIQVWDLNPGDRLWGVLVV